MATITRRNNQPLLSESGELILAKYEQRLRVEEDLARATIRNYLSDLRHFVAWCEFTWKQGREADSSFAPEVVTTPTLTDYRTYLQRKLQLKPNSVNRSLVSLKRYFAWLLDTGQIMHNPAKAVKLVGEEIIAPGLLPPPQHQNQGQLCKAHATLTQTRLLRQFDSIVFKHLLQDSTQSWYTRHHWTPERKVGQIFNPYFLTVGPFCQLVLYLSNS